MCLHPAVDGFSRLAHTEHLPDEKRTAAAGFWQRARRFFAVHGIETIHRVVIDSGVCHRSAEFARRLGDSRHRWITPSTPRHERKSEAVESDSGRGVLYARSCASEDDRSCALATWNRHYNYRRSHTALGNQPRPPKSATTSSTPWPHTASEQSQMNSATLAPGEAQAPHHRDKEASDR